MPYREDSKPSAPRAFCTPTGTDDEVIFYDAIVRLVLDDTHLVYVLTTGGSCKYKYETREDALKNLRVVAAAKQAWIEYKQRLSAPMTFANEE